MYRRIRVAKGSATVTAGATAVLLFDKTPKLPAAAAAVDKAVGGAITSTIRHHEHSAAKGVVATLYPDRGPRRLFLVGLGESDQFTAAEMRVAAAALARAAFAARESRVRLANTRDIKQLKPDALGHAIADGLAIAGFDFDRFKGAASSKDPEGKPIDLTLITNAELRQAIQEGLDTGLGVTTARTLAATPPNVANPRYILGRCRALARKTTLRCTAIDARKAKQLGMGGLLAVGQAGSTPPALICLEHRLARRGATRPILLVGKAVTFDTGGYSLKTSMAGMKYDKCGGMAVIGAMEAVARLGIPRAVVGLIPCAENMIDETAYRVDDILTLYNGVTVEVTNTDAEGRLILADALAYGTKRYNPSAVIDLATLTGGVVVALGTHCAGMFCNDEKLHDRLSAAAQFTGERLWRLPLWPEHRELMAGTHADLVNSGARKAHPIQGAAFLSHFIGPEGPKKMPTLPWAHLDIAGVADTENDGPLYAKGPTGFGVRLLTHLIKTWPAR